MKNFWENLNRKCHKEKRLILALAPMAGVTDLAFRLLCTEYGADVVYSEMASVTALVYNPKKTLEMLVSSKKEAPYVIQLFGSKPEHFGKAAKLLSDKKLLSKLLAPDINIKKNLSGRLIPQPPLRKGAFCEGLDINFGCPVKKVLKQGAGAALMDDIELSRKIIESVAANTDIPISIKIRSKANKNDCLKFLDGLHDLPIAAVMIHGRSLKQGFAGLIDTKIIKEARNYFDGAIIANGGINNYEDAQRIWTETEADGLGIARGAMGKPWIFKQLRIKNSKLRINEDFIIKNILKHAKLVEKIKGEQGIIEMRSQWCAYMNGFPGAKELRCKLVRVKSVAEIKEILKYKS